MVEDRTQMQQMPQQHKQPDPEQFVGTVQPDLDLGRQTSEPCLLGQLQWLGLELELELGLVLPSTASLKEVCE